MKVYREHSIVISAAGVVMALAGVVVLGMGLAGSPGAGQLVLGVLLLVIGSFTAAVYGEVSIGKSEVEIRLVPVPRRTIKFADVKSVEPIDISPMRFGGWGWRRRGGQTTALIMHGGPGARLCLTDGSEFIVSGRGGRALVAALG